MIKTSGVSLARLEKLRSLASLTRSVPSRCDDKQKEAVTQHSCHFERSEKSGFSEQDFSQMRLEMTPDRAPGSGAGGSYCLLRFFDRLPTKNPILKSVILSFIVLLIATITIGGPSSFSTTGNILRYFLIGTLFYIIRILALGIGIGYGYDKVGYGT